MKGLCILLLFIIAGPSMVLAQSNYKPGYVVTWKGDTLHGFIDYREWGLNPKSIRFRTFPENKVEKFNPRQISSFGIDNRARYQTYMGAISTDPANIASVIEERDTTFKLDTVFLEQLQKGKNLVLFAYSDNLKIRYFIGGSPDFTPAELVYRLYYDTGQVDLNKGRTVNENTYQKQLFALAAKYDMLSDKVIRAIEEADYKEDHLTRVVKMINGTSSKKSKPPR